MSLSKLVDLIENDSIAETVQDGDDGENELKSIGENVCQWYKQDWDSMTEWVEFAELGVELMKPTKSAKSTPWEGAANFHSPMMMEASLDFANRASLEVLRPKNLVKADIIGRDKDGEKGKAADRVTTFMNYQINHQIKDWRKKQKKLFYSMPSYGTVFKKCVYDPLFGRPTTHLIQYPNFAVSQGAESLEEARSFTQILAFSRNQVTERVEAELWLDQDYYSKPAEGENASDTGSNEDVDATDPEDNEERWLEQRSSIDLDGDGYAEPYIITVHEKSGLVARIEPQYDEQSIFVKYNDQVMSLPEAVAKRAEDQAEQQIEITEEIDYSEFELVRIEATQDIVQYGLIPSFDGTLLDLGYFHLLGALTMGINTTTNQLLNAGHLANLQGGFLAKGARKKMGPISMRPGQYISTNIEAAQLSNSIMPHQFKEPSQTLFQLNEKMEAEGRGLVASTDLDGQITAQTAPTTALAIIHESLLTLSALMDNVIQAMSAECQILFHIDQRTLDPKEYQNVLDDEQADFKRDFNSQLMDVIPTANPEMSSKAQRIQIAESFMSQLGMIMQAGGQGMPVVKFWADSMNSELASQVFPEEPGEMSPEEEKLIQAQTQAQQQENELKAQQLDLAKRQAELLEREYSRLEEESQANNDKTKAQAEQIREDTRASAAKLSDEIEQLKADVLLTLEKVESEDVKNDIGVFTTKLDAIKVKTDAIGALTNATSTTGTNRRDKVATLVKSSLTGTA